MNDEAQAQIDALRAQIDTIDDALLRLLADRLDVARRLAPPKHAIGRPGRTPSRESEIIERLSGEGCVPPDIVALVWSALFTGSRWVQSVPTADPPAGITRERAARSER